MGSPLATFTDGYFRYIAESVVNAEILQKQNETDRICNKVLYSAFNRNILSVKTTRKHFCVVSNYVNGE